MDLQRIIERIEEGVLVFLMKPSLQGEIEQAKTEFYEILEEMDNSSKVIADFNIWLIYDYRGKQGKSFLEQYYHEAAGELSGEEIMLIKKMMETYISLYEIRQIGKADTVIRDIFTRKEIQLPSNRMVNTKQDVLLLTRVIELEDGFWTMPCQSYVPILFRHMIERNMLERFEEYKKSNLFSSWEKFLKEHSLYLYKYISLIEDLLTKENMDEDYTVWQSCYLIKDSRNIKQLLSKHEGVKLEYEEEGELCFHIMKQRKILGEMVIKNNRLELECTSLQERKKLKEILETILGERIQHYKDEKVKMEDIL